MISGLSGNRLLSLAQVAALIATGWFIWVHSVIPRLSHQTVAALVGDVFLYVFFAWTVSAAIAFCIYLSVSMADLKDVVRASIRSSAPAMWFAPALILLSAPQPAAHVASLLLVANTTRLLISQWRTNSAEIGPTLFPLRRQDPRFDAAVAGAEPVASTRSVALAISVSAQAGLVANLWNYHLLSSAFVAASVAILTSLTITVGVYEPGKPPALPWSALSTVLAVMLAAALSIGGFGAALVASADPAWTNGSGSPPGIVDATRAILHRLLQGQEGDSRDRSAQEETAAEKARREEAPPETKGDAASGDFPGVILWPKVKPHMLLVAPIPSLSSRSGAVPARPFTIPFSGEYWMFRVPFTHPPAGSFFRRGNPLEFAFRTTDGRTMIMEAHQKIDPPIDIGCCGRIQAVVNNAETAPVSLQIILNDTAGHRSESLGQVLAGNGSLWETLDFPIPAMPALQEFDAITVVFHRIPARQTKSARIAIDRFVLIPRTQ